MSDTAAFFANKKKKKKAFKFNANLVDATTVTPTVHVSAPAVSTGQESAVVDVTGGVAAFEISDASEAKESKDTSEMWDDEALAANLSKKGVPQAPGSEVLDMKSLDNKLSEQEDIAQKLRVEQTKAQLAAAREGMEREAAKLKEQREKKETDKQETVAPRFGAAAAAMGMGPGTKWVPPHLRASGGAGMSRGRMGGAMGQKIDVQNEELFPDLASADKMLEKKQAPAFKVPKKTPVGGGATWASKPTKPARTEPTVPARAAKEPEANVPEAEPQEAVSKTNAEPSPVAETSPTKISKPAGVKKKKKKDVSSFKPS